MKTCYLTGKMRGVKCLNFPLFNQATALLRSQEWNVISPVEMDRAAKEPWTSETDPDYANENHEISDADCRRLIRRDVDAILSLRPLMGDIIVCLPDWRDESTGAFGEAGVGRWAMVPMYEMQLSNCDFAMTLIPEDVWGAKANMRAEYSAEELFLKINPALRANVTPAAGYPGYFLVGTRSYVSEQIAAAILKV